MRIVTVQVFGRVATSLRGSRAISLEADLESHEIGHTQDALKDMQTFLDRELADWKNRVEDAASDGS